MGSVRQRLEATPPEREYTPERPRHAGLSHGVVPQLSVRQRAEHQRATAPPPKSAARQNMDEWEAWHKAKEERWAREEAEKRAEQERRAAAEAARAERERKVAQLNLATIQREFTATMLGLTKDEFREAVSQLTPEQLSDPDSCAFERLGTKLIEARGR